MNFTINHLSRTATSATLGVCRYTSGYENDCNDGLDNDCNGLTDEEDPYCQ